MMVSHTLRFSGVKENGVCVEDAERTTVSPERYEVDSMTTAASIVSNHYSSSMPAC